MAEMNNSEDSDRLSLDMLETALPTEVPTPSDDSDDEVSGGPVKVTLDISGSPIEIQWGSQKYPG